MLDSPTRTYAAGGSTSSPATRKCGRRADTGTHQRGREQAQLDAVNRRGRTIACVTTILPLLAVGDGDGAPVRGAIVLMEDSPAET